MTSSSIVWAARGQSAWKLTSFRYQFHAPSLNSRGLFPFHPAEAQLDPSTCFGRHGSTTNKKVTFPPYISQTNTSYRSQLSGRRPLPKHVTHANANTPQSFPGSRHKKTRHNGMHFFDILTSKSGPKMVHFVYFDFEIYFAS